MGLQTLPEGLLVTGALQFGGQTLGLSCGQSANLSELLTNAYSHIYADPAFTNVSSALPYCFSVQTHTNGHYFLYHPKDMPPEPKAIVFLHGYGGNFQFYIWALKEAFPTAVIMAPSWGVSWHRGSSQYVKDMIRDCEERLGIQIKRPWLMAISAGGRGGFALYNQMPTRFHGYVCLASAPETSVAQNLRQNLKILMLNGTNDPMVPIGVARQQAALAKRRVTRLELVEINGNHFFFLSHRDEMFGIIRRFMGPE